jgi:AraC family transcriptional regulator
LKTSDWPVQEIAQMTGFHSAVNFVRAFRQRVGQTPGVWRTSS